MDEDLRQYLEAMESRQETRFDSRLATRLEEMESRQEARFDARLDTRLEEMERRQEARFEEMDSRLDTRLEEMERRQEARFDSRLETRLDEAFTRFSQHILHEVGSRFDEVNKHLESIDTRLRLQAGLIQSGARAMARFSEFSENSEQRWIVLTGRVEALEKRFEGK